MVKLLDQLLKNTGGGSGLLSPLLRLHQLILSFQMNGVNLQIDWTPNPEIEQIKQYDIYYCETETGNYQKIGTANQPQFEYFSGIYNGYYSIIAVNNTGESPSSTPVAYTTHTIKFTIAVARTNPVSRITIQDTGFIYNLEMINN